MKKTILVFLSFVFLFPNLQAFELKDGDRVAFVGDAFIEREQYGGWMELAATTQFPECNVTFRNLGWSADTPAGVSRNGLSLIQAGREAPEEGWKQLLKQIETYKPNVIVLGYGMAASLPGGTSAEDFGKDLERLLDEAPKAAGGETRFLILGAPPYFKQSLDDENSMANRIKSLTEINRILEAVAGKRSISFVPVADLGNEPSFSQNGNPPDGSGLQRQSRG